ncbi:KWG Leptospira [Posidoniimonas corsicana]|uniref:KWG Leptospira n=1 Tax=Posidoniimonas corsicana TaxID=1938618 RepID=A0A5C5VC35_9BACT|nr:WG repeat-containing protein [Posidoniimonas corsicana]TWT36176.1 KWG Leptospira [Posidoniimonas corsicana]
MARCSENRQLYPTRIDGRFGCIDSAGQVVIDPKFDVAGGFREGVAGVWMWSGPPDDSGRPSALHGFINDSGDWIAKPAYAESREFSDGLAAVQLGKKWGYLDLSGRMAIEPRFRVAWEFSEGLAPVELNAKTMAMINRQGEVVFEMAGARLGGCGDGLIPCEQKRSWSYLRPDGSVAFEVECTAAGGFQEGRAGVLRSGLTGYLDTDGQWAIPPTYPQGGNFSEGLAAVELPAAGGGSRAPGEPQTFAYIDRSGKQAIEQTFLGAQPFSDGLAAVQIDDHDRYAYIDRQGTVAIPPMKCGFAKPFEGELAAVQHPRNFDRFGYINRQGEFVWRW